MIAEQASEQATPDVGAHRLRRIGGGASARLIGFYLDRGGQRRTAKSRGEGILERAARAATEFSSAALSGSPLSSALNRKRSPAAPADPRRILPGRHVDGSRRPYPRLRAAKPAPHLTGRTRLSQKLR